MELEMRRKSSCDFRGVALVSAWRAASKHKIWRCTDGRYVLFVSSRK